MTANSPGEEVTPVVSVSLTDINAWRDEWLEANDPGDGTDCVTPFDHYLYSAPDAPDERSLNMVKRLGDIVSSLSSGHIHPSPYDLYYATKNPGDGTGWSYSTVGLGVEDLADIQAMLARSLGVEVPQVDVSPMIQFFRDSAARRPANWADQTVEHLLVTYERDGMDAAQNLFLLISKRDRPKLADSVVVSGRFREVLNAFPAPAQPAPAGSPEP